MHKNKYTYTRYIVELSGGEIFLVRKFNTQIIFTAKISQSAVHVCSSSAALSLPVYVIVDTYDIALLKFSQRRQRMTAQKLWS